MKPCPFCGGQNSKLDETMRNGVSFIICNDCKAEGPKSINERKAKINWNFRINDWISVDAILPQNGQLVLGWHDSFGVVKVNFECSRNPEEKPNYAFIGDGINTFFQIGKITHWMPLPEKPMKN
jgi:Lar family restriction alleviation protein